MNFSYIKLFLIAIMLIINQVCIQAKTIEKKFSKLATSQERIDQEFSEPITADKLLFFIEKIKNFIIKSEGQRSAPSTSKKMIAIKALIDAYTVLMQLKNNHVLSWQESEEILMTIFALHIQVQDMGLQDLQENNQLLLDQLDQFVIINQ